MSDILKDGNKNVPDKKPTTLKAIDSFRHFFSNEYHTFLVEKSERLASALYIITGFIPAEEPVRLKLRTRALDLISCSADAHGLSGMGVDTFTSRCAEIGSLLETALSAGLISHMNARLICDEYASLAHFAKEERGNIAETNNVNESDIQNKFLPQPTVSKSQNNDQSSSRTIKRTNGAPKKRQSDRRASILALFKNKNGISIKDATSSIIGCSEKTIQRELLSLVEEGVLVKEGERRWTVYRKP